MKYARSLSLLMSLAVTVAVVHAADLPADHKISPEGEALAKYLDRTDVEHKWEPKHYVDWLTGEPTTKPAHGGVASSHCSAFAAAVADKLDVYLLRPPEHGQALLANAQYNWLEKDGKEKGWSPVQTPEEAQADANNGELVIVVYRAPDVKKPGHIAIVHPAVMDEKQLEDTGPEITQAGATNYAHTFVGTGFNHHPGAWDKTGHTVKFYAHKVVDIEQKIADAPTAEPSQK